MTLLYFSVGISLKELGGQMSRPGSVIPIPKRYRGIFKYRYRYRRRYNKYRIPTKKSSCRYFRRQWIHLYDNYFHTVIFLLWSLFCKYLNVDGIVRPYSLDKTY